MDLCRRGCCSTPKSPLQCHLGHICSHYPERLVRSPTFPHLVGHFLISKAAPYTSSWLYHAVVNTTRLGLHSDCNKWPGRMPAWEKVYLWACLPQLPCQWNAGPAQPKSILAFAWSLRTSAARTATHQPGATIHSRWQSIVVSGVINPSAQVLISHKEHAKMGTKC